MSLKMDAISEHDESIFTNCQQQDPARHDSYLSGLSQNNKGEPAQITPEKAAKASKTQKLAGLINKGAKNKVEPIENQQPAAEQPILEELNNDQSKNKQLTNNPEQGEIKDNKQKEENKEDQEVNVNQKKNKRSFFFCYKRAKNQIDAEDVIRMRQKEEKKEGQEAKVEEVNVKQNKTKKSFFFCFKSAKDQSGAEDEIGTRQKAEISNLERSDRYQRNVLHKAALDQDFRLVRDLMGKAIFNMNPSNNQEINLKDDCYSDAELSEKVRAYLDQTDKFGNTPLILACINNFTNKTKKMKCVQEFLLMKPKVNMQNNRTLWTALTWCSFYGDYDCICLLLGAKEPKYVLEDEEGAVVKSRKPAENQLPIKGAAANLLNTISPGKANFLFKPTALTQTQNPTNQVSSDGPIDAQSSDAAGVKQSPKNLEISESPTQNQSPDAAGSKQSPKNLASPDSPTNTQSPDAAAVKRKAIYLAYAFWPDYKGFYPIDHYGIQNKVTSLTENSAEVIISTVIAQIHEFDAKPRQTPLDFDPRHYRFLQSPLLRSTLLYWTIYFKIKTPQVLEALLDMDYCYAEMPLASVGLRNCYHACSAGHNKYALKRLYLTKQKRYERASKELEQSLEKEAARRWAQDFALQLKEEEKLIYDEDFWNYIKKVIPHWITNFRKELPKSGRGHDRTPSKSISRPPSLPSITPAPGHSSKDQIKKASKAKDKQAKKKEIKPSSELPDKFGNTPLHVACFEGHVDIVKYFLQKDVNYYRKNDEGWRCIDLIQDSKIERTFLEKQRGTLPKLKAKTLYANDGTEIEDEEEQAVFLDEKMMKIADFENERPPVIPDVVLVFKVGNDRSMENRVNFNISLIRQSFDCYLTQGLDEKTLFLMIKMRPEKLMEECVKNNYMVKMRNDFSYQPFNIEKKTEFEPFRSRQRQEITLNSLNKLIDIQQLKELKVLQNLFLMHTVSGLERIDKKWIQLKKWYYIQPFTGFMNFVREGKDKKFNSITALKVYFGEKFSFYFAWTSFIICYLPFLAIPGLIIFIITRADHQSPDIALPVWVMYNSLFITFLVERWKRKSSEIAVKWGMLDLLNEDVAVKDIRKEYSGDEIVSESTGALTKYNKTSYKAFYFICGTIILLVASAGIILLFLGTQKIKVVYPHLTWIESVFVSAINGIVIQVLNMSYAKAVQFFVLKENHKYTNTYESSVIFKTVLFKALTSYLGVFYLTFIIREDFEVLFSTLFSLLITRSASSAFVTLILPWIKVKFWKGFLPYPDFDPFITETYFWNSKSLQEQKEFEFNVQYSTHKKTRSRTMIQGPPKVNIGPINEDTMSYKDAKKHLKLQKKLETAYSVGRRRPVLDCETGEISQENWEISQVELNYMRHEKADILDFYSDALIQFGYITMFAPAFTLGPIVALVLNVIDTKVKLFAFIKIYKRPISEKVGGLGDWLTAWELISILALFVNALSLFFNVSIKLNFADDIYSNYENDQSARLAVDDNINRLWLFAIALHVVLILKVLVIIFIEDKPSWVVGVEEKIEFDEDQAVEQQRDEEIAKGMKRKAAREETFARKAVQKLKLNRIKKNETDAGRRQREVNEFMSSPNQTPKQSTLFGLMKTMKNKDTDVQQTPAPQIAATKDLIKPQPTPKTKGQTKVLQTKKTRKITMRNTKGVIPAIKGPSLRIRQAIKSILFNTYINVERDLLYRRISDINKATEEIVSICDHCQKFRNAVECRECKDKYCNTCFFAMHKNPKISGHSTIPYGKSKTNTNEPSAMDNIPLDAKPAGYMAEYMRSQNLNFSPNYWRKFEAFSFPTRKGLFLMPELRKSYKYLYQIYISNNGIKTRDELRGWEKSLKFKHLRTQIETPKEEKPTLIKVHYPEPPKLEGTLDLTQQDIIRSFGQIDKFNTEEKLFMNEIAFLIFKRKGMRVTFEDFLERLKVLQEGGFKEKVDLIFELIDRDDDGFIALDEVIDFFKKAFIQNIIVPRNKDTIIEELFRNSNKISREVAWENMMYNPTIINLFAVCTQMPLIPKETLQKEKPPHEAISIRN